MTKNASALSESLEDYLEAIFCIIDQRKVARPKDIIARMNVSGASVTGALRLLAERKLICYAPHDLISFTIEGAKIAGEIYRRHLNLRTFLTDVLLIESQQADEAACKMEHVLPDTIIGRMVQLADFLQQKPAFARQWRDTLTGENDSAHEES